MAKAKFKSNRVNPKKKAAKRKPAEPRLSLKQRSFIVWMVSAEVNGNATEAARRAGYKGSDATLATVGKENIRKPHIAAELEKLTKEALKAADVTVEKVLRDLEDARKKALSEGQYASAIRGSELQGKYLKMFVEKIEHVQTIEDVSTAELTRLLKEIAEAGGIDLDNLAAGNESPVSDLPNPAGNTTTH